MPALGDVIKIIINQRLFGQAVRNVYHYETVLASGTDTPTNVFDAFELAVIGPVQAIQNTALVYEGAVIENLNDELFFEEIPLALTGDGLGVPMPSYVAFGVKLVRSFKATRNGGKRYAGVQEESVLDNDQTLLQATQDLVTDGLILLLDLNVLPALSGAYAPVIFRKPEVGPPPVIEFSNPIKAAQFSETVTTQNSRKAGVGE